VLRHDGSFAAPENVKVRVYKIARRRDDRGSQHPATQSNVPKREKRDGSRKQVTARRSNAGHHPNFQLSCHGANRRGAGENAAPTPENAVLLTIFLKHDQSRPLSELNAQLDKQG
jgi:hypothetical protein